MPFTFRADASSVIGFGHLSRVVALAAAARRIGAEVILVASQAEPAVEAFVDRAGFPLNVIDAAPGTADDARATRTLAGSGSYVVVDGYAFRGPWLAELGGDDRIVVYIDDLAREHLDCDVVLNPNVSGPRERYDTAPRTLLLVGPSFAIVDDRFVAARGKKSSCPERAERLLVTMGGSDPPGATLTAIEALSLLDGDRMHVRVVIGAANQRREAIIAAAAACSRHAVEVRTSVADMAEEMLWTDVALTASGVTATELACVGVPGVTFAIVDNQEPIAAELARLGMFDVLESGNRGAPAIALSLSRLVRNKERRAAMVEIQRRTIDGMGKDRVVARLLALRSGDRHNADPDGGDRG